MLCFASAQDRTNPRRIKGYFNANGNVSPTFLSKAVPSKSKNSGGSNVVLLGKC
jgi:hypothetical protein